MKKLWVYMKDYAKESILGPLFKLLEASFELFVPLVMAAIIDTGIANGDKGYIFKMCGVLIGLAIIGLVCSITAQYFAARASVGFASTAGIVHGSRVFSSPQPHSSAEASMSTASSSAILFLMAHLRIRVFDSYII